MLTFESSSEQSWKSFFIGLKDSEKMITGEKGQRKRPPLFRSGR